MTGEAPVKIDENEFSLNTGKVDQMILDGKKPEEALAELYKLEKDIKNDQQRGMFYVRSAEILINMSEDRKAIEELNKVVNINAKPLSKLLAYSYIASINNNMGNQKEAALYLEKAQEIYPEIKEEDKNPRMLIYYVSSALINSDRADYEKAINDMNAANDLIRRFHLTNNEYKESITMEKAFAYSMLKQPEKASRTIKKWHSSNSSQMPRNKDLDDLEIRYKVALAKGEYETALKCTEELKDDNGFSIHIAKGNVYYVWGKDDDARKEFELALKESKDPWFREQASKMLEKLK